MSHLETLSITSTTFINLNKNVETKFHLISAVKTAWCNTSDENWSYVRELHKSRAYRHAALQMSFQRCNNVFEVQTTLKNVKRRLRLLKQLKRKEPSRRIIILFMSRSALVNNIASQPRWFNVDTTFKRLAVIMKLTLSL